MLEGAVQVTPQRFEYESESEASHYLGIYRRDHSWEAESHLRDFRLQEEPVCWMLLGYVPGYTTNFSGTRCTTKRWPARVVVATTASFKGVWRSSWPDDQAIAQD